MTAVRKNKIKLREVNRHLVCRLCRGYYVDATTIAECLHSFCRSCIIKYLEKNSFCPICEVQIHKTKPYMNLRLDKALQDVVYKLVPGLYHAEMARRRAFYENRLNELPLTTPEQRGVEERLIFSPEDSISLSLEYMDCPEPESESLSSRSSESGEDFPLQLGLMKVRRGDATRRKESVDSNEPGQYPMRYLLCPAVVSISLLKKFIAQKFDLSPKIQVEVIHKRVCLPDHYTLMDVAYIFTWKRMAPMRLFYQLYQIKREKVCFLPPPEGKLDSVKPLTPIVECKKELPTPMTVEKPFIVPTLTKDETPIKRELNIPCIKVDNNVTVNSEKIVNNVKKENNVVSSPKVNSMQNKLEATPNSAKTAVSNMRIDSVRKEPQTNGKIPIDKKLAEGKPKKGSMKKNLETDKKPSVPVDDNLNKRPKESLLKVWHGISANNNVPAQQISAIKPKFMSKLELKAIPKVPLQVTASERPEKQVEPPPAIVAPLMVTPKLELKTEADVPEKTVGKPTETILLNHISGKLEAVPVSPEKEERLGKELPPKSNMDKQASKKSSVQQLKTFRKEKTNAPKTNLNSFSSTSPVTITTMPQKGKLSPKVEANVSIEIRADKKEISEYDFESSSPPNRIMSLQEYTQSEMYKAKFPSSNSNGQKNVQEVRKKVVNGKPGPKMENGELTSSKKKVVPLLHRINVEKKGNGVKADGKKDNPSPRVINIQTPPELKGSNSPPKPIKIENKGGEYSIKQSLGDNGKPKQNDGKLEEDAELLRSLLKRKEALNSALAKQKEGPSLAKKQKLPSTMFPKTVKPALSTPVDLTKADAAPSVAAKSPLEKIMEVTKNPLENLMEMAKKQGDKKDPNNMLEMLISIAQKQSIEPLLKVPQYPQGSAGGVGQAVTPSAINQALQFFQKLSSEMDARSQVEQAVPPKPPNYVTFQQFYQQQLDFVRMLKRQQASLNSEVPAKIPKLSPNKEGKISPAKDESVLKNVERTLSQIQQQAEMQSRIAAAQNLKNMPNLLPYYSHPGSPAFRPNKSPPAGTLGQSPLKTSQLSPHGEKSPTELQQHQMFAAQQQQLFNAGLTSEMSFHQMFQQYLSQQIKMNQRKTEPQQSPPPARTTTPHEKLSPSQTVTSPKPSSEPPMPKLVPSMPTKT